MLMHYEIAAVKIRINNLSDVEMTRLELFKAASTLSSHTSITIKKVEQINVDFNVLNINSIFSFTRLPGGKNGYIFYSVEKDPVAFMVTDTSWENINIEYLENIQRGKYRIIDYALRIAFNDIVIMNGGLVVHSSAIHYRNNGLIFSAPSGTGKSTHTSFWRQSFNAGTINDDAPALIREKDRIMVCGTPWSGSTDLFENIRVPLHAIVVLSRHHENEISKMSMPDIMKKLFPRCMLPYFNQKLMDKGIENFQNIINCVPVYHLKCTPTLEAAKAVKACLNL